MKFTLERVDRIVLGAFLIWCLIMVALTVVAQLKKRKQDDGDKEQ